MSKTLAKILVKALLIVAFQLHDWLFSPELTDSVRMWLRERWWKAAEKAARTKSTRDDMRAASWRRLMKFETPPKEAIKRGDPR